MNYENLSDGFTAGDGFTAVYFYHAGLKLGWVNLHILIRWVTFPRLLGQAWIVILSNIAFTSNTSDCSIRDY